MRSTQFAVSLAVAALGAAAIAQAAAPPAEIVMNGERIFPQEHDVLRGRLGDHRQPRPACDIPRQARLRNGGRVDSAEHRGHATAVEVGKP